MVVSPADLYRMTERSVLQLRDQDGLVRFGDMEDDYELPSLGTGPNDRRWPDFLAGDAEALGQSAEGINWWKTGLVSAALTLSAGALDKRAYDTAVNHQNSRWVTNGVQFGDALPFVAIGASAIFAFDDSRPQLSDTGIAALEAAGVGLVGTEALKYAVGRARPTAGLGTTDFKSGSSQDQYHSFPSNHVVAMWAAVTPYAQEYDMPWLYGAAAITNLARIGSREHWVSDTVGSAAIGYALGYVAWDAHREARLNKNTPQVLIGPNSVNLAWQLN
jgi:membrane-associated phospholipid phosphatase